MCLITNKKSRIAKVDIKVVKLLTHDLRAPFYPFQYELGVEVSTEIKDCNDPTPYSAYETEYLRKTFGDWESEVMDGGKLKSYSEGFHSMSLNYFNESVEDLTYNAFAAIIPKGATYIQDFNGLYISDRLIVVEEL